MKRMRNMMYTVQISTDGLRTTNHSLKNSLKWYAVLVSYRKSQTFIKHCSNSKLPKLLHMVEEIQAPHGTPNPNVPVRYGQLHSPVQ